MAAVPTPPTPRDAVRGGATPEPGAPADGVRHALDALTGLEDRPLGEHVAAFERAYGALASTLDEARA